MSDRLTKIFYFLSGGGAFFGTLAVTRSYLSGDKYTGNEEMYGKTVIVTGGNRGIGKETAKNLAKRGARVILACKDMEKCQETKAEITNETFNKNIECKLCDLASLESIKNFTNQIKKEEKFLHVLVNNAGVMWCPKSYTKEGFEKHLGINHLGHFYLTNLLLPKLIESSPSRVLVVTCKDHIKGKINFDDLNSAKKYNEDEAYNQSKLANILFANELSEKVRGFGVTVNCIDPGYSYTDLMRNSSVHRSPYSPVSLFFKVFLKTAEMGAQSVIYAAVSKRYETETGKYIKDFQEVDLTENAQNKKDAKRLWLVSEKWTRLD